MDRKDHAPTDARRYLLRIIMAEYHRCNDLNKLTGTEIVYSIFYGDEGEEPNWWFHLFREANEKDVADGEANSIGETMSSTAVVISFCPFCGKQLKNRCKR